MVLTQVNTNATPLPTGKPSKLEIPENDEVGEKSFEEYQATLEKCKGNRKWTNEEEDCVRFFHKKFNGDFEAISELWKDHRTPGAVQTRYNQIEKRSKSSLVHRLSGVGLSIVNEMKKIMTPVKAAKVNKDLDVLPAIDEEVEEVQASELVDPEETENLDEVSVEKVENNDFKKVVENENNQGQMQSEQVVDESEAEEEEETCIRKYNNTCFHLLLLFFWFTIPIVLCLYCNYPQEAKAYVDHLYNSFNECLVYMYVAYAKYEKAIQNYLQEMFGQM